MQAHSNIVHLGEADGAGRILLEGQHAPVSYHLTATRDGARAYAIKIELSAPRDWLLDRGFDREVTLIRQNGEKVRVRFENKLATTDNISVNLEACEEIHGSIGDFRARYPELNLVSASRPRATAH
jgi:hypothetical protein